MDKKYLERLRSAEKMTAGEVMGPIMKITRQEDADEVFAAYVESLIKTGRTQEEAESIVKSNIGYWGGYYDHETRLRLEKLFNCSHPVFGKAADHKPTAREAFEAGVRLGEKARSDECKS